ncbi:tetratricopeptide repeat protein [Montanilutibacter psychrotolerans]|uniref:Uncharacterized protein n=1 Tax=Montanilutibacter psychrotolerans TaxID=1327343 RepID=A0A3M8SPB8_9GAMM|nr:tetratricopeptide repeat-containing glycosyltransferase family protein [Lysobacter psychrotolerans]RNF83109.1 hypothetical protein EER27_11355 [Lysobacter psychrotolerans]
MTIEPPIEAADRPGQADGEPVSPTQPPAPLHAALEAAAGFARVGDMDAATTCLRRLRDSHPGQLDSHRHLAALLQSLRQHDAALAALDEGIRCFPGAVELHLARSAVLRELGEYDQALIGCDNAIALAPDAAEAHNRRGIVLEHLGAVQAALAAYARATGLAPQWHVPWRNLATLHRAAGRSTEAIAALHEAVARAPDDVASHQDLAELLLIEGNYAEGWQHYEWRFGAGGRPPPFPATTAPVWDGSPLHGAIVMVWMEQGLGDQLQFARYLDCIAALGGRVWLQVPPPLLALFGNLSGVERVIGGVDVPIGYDLQIPLMSLARIFHPRMGIPANLPYLHVPPGIASRDLRGDTGDRSSVHVGIVWASRASHPAASRRDIPLQVLARLGDVDGVVLHSLQFGGAHVCAGEPRVRAHAATLGDFADTAALVIDMDLVVTVDTAMAHLAGGLGAPTWVLLSEPADWRWQVGRDDTPWYPGMRLFRQSDAGDWEPVMERVIEALRQRVLDQRVRSRFVFDQGDRA